MTIHLVLGVLLVGAIQFVLAAAGGALWFAPIVGGVAALFWRLLDPDERGTRGLQRIAATVVAGYFLGTLPALLLDMRQSPFELLAGAAIALATGAGIYQLSTRGRSAVCVLCKRPAADTGGFDCPRCADRVCARPTCWNPRYFRCVRCHEREIVVFPIAEKWWVTRLGARVRDGECTSCGKEAREADLRECGQCHWPMCRRCWDYYNGSCRKCEWVIPDVPARLRPFVRGARGRHGAEGAAARPDGSMRARRS